MAPERQSKEAQKRLEEMRHLISMRNGEAAPRSRHRSMTNPQTQTQTPPPPTPTDELVQMINDAASEADRSLLRAASNQSALGIDLQRLAEDLKQVRRIRPCALLCVLTGSVRRAQYAACGAAREGTFGPRQVASPVRPSEEAPARRDVGEGGHVRGACGAVRRGVVRYGAAR